MVSQFSMSPIKITIHLTYNLCGHHAVSRVTLILYKNEDPILGVATLLIKINVIKCIHIND